MPILYEDEMKRGTCMSCFSPTTVWCFLVFCPGVLGSADISVDKDGLIVNQLLLQILVLCGCRPVVMAWTQLWFSYVCFVQFKCATFFCMLHFLMFSHFGGIMNRNVPWQKHVCFWKTMFDEHVFLYLFVRSFVCSCVCLFHIFLWRNNRWSHVLPWQPWFASHGAQDVAALKFLAEQSPMTSNSSGRALLRRLKAGGSAGPTATATALRAVEGL